MEICWKIWSTSGVENQATASSRSTQERTGSSNGSVELGLLNGQVIQEFGWDDDVDDAFRARIEDATGEELVDEYYGDVCDGALIWWRDDDGDEDDLADLLVDAKGNLDDGSGVIWVMIPALGTDGYVEHIVVVCSRHTDDQVKLGPANQPRRILLRSSTKETRWIAQPQLRILIKNLLLHNQVPE